VQLASGARGLPVPRTSRAILATLAICAAVVFVAQFTVRHLSDDSAQFIQIGLNGITAGALYFVAASGFTLIFGLLRVVNLAHGAFVLLGGYIGYQIVQDGGSWFLAAAGGAAAIAVLGVVSQQVLLRRIQGQELREALVTLGLAIVIADQALAHWGGAPVDIQAPSGLSGATNIHVAGVLYPTFRLFALGLAIAVGVGLYLLLKHTRAGLIIRAGVDDRPMVAALGINVQLVFVLVFALGAALVGLSGVVGGSYLSLSPGDDGHYLLYSLIVVIVGGMGSVTGAALGALLVGVVDEFAKVYVPTYSVLVTFGLLVLVLAARPPGLLGRAA
jgi:branched-chain amino acid transport system permease protein